jgi:hypothetical protein
MHTFKITSMPPAGSNCKMFHFCYIAEAKKALSGISYMIYDTEYDGFYVM